MGIEKNFFLENINPVDFFGTNNSNLNSIEKAFPKLRIIARDNILKVSGEEKDIAAFEVIFINIVDRIEKYGIIRPEELITLLNSDSPSEVFDNGSSKDVLVYGRNGMLIKARTPNQKKMVDACLSNDMIFAIGPAGTGKTYTAVAIAVQALKNKEVKKIILTRPAVEAGENLGFLPGDIKEKLDPYMQPLYDALYDMIPVQKLVSYLEDRTIEIAPLAFMRGRTLDYAFVILDEAQNATDAQLKMFLTRMGKSAKFIITGDITQIDLPKNQPSGLFKAQELLKNINGIEFIYLDEKDVVRHHLVTKIIKAYSL
ncbi:MAG: PhoH family protein [Bacteroidales bacterium]|nr:PhoH family protein [Bacteroidales bacterium]